MAGKQNEESAPSPDPGDILDRLLEEGLTDGLEPDEALVRLGSLIDCSHDLRRVDGLRVATDWVKELNRASLSDADLARLHYFAGNAWSGLDELLHARGESTWDWERYELEQEVLNLRIAASRVQASASPLLACQVNTNLGNALSKIGRFVEALQYWNQALAIDSNFGMAIGNRGYGLLNYAKQLFDPGHIALFLERCSADLTRALRGELEPGVHEWLAPVLLEAKAAAQRLGLPEETLFHEHSLGDSSAEVSYREWCLRHCLFINPLNDLGEHSIAAADVLHLPTMVLGINESPSLLGFFNQLKQEFVSARYMYYEGLMAYEPHYSDRQVTQINTLDYPAYSLAVERVKASFRAAYSILDKLAFFLNDYLSLGIPGHRTSLKSFWFKKQNRENGLRAAFVDRPNWPMRGLYWLSKDLAEDRLGFKDAMSPDAQGIAVVRNHLEHRYLKLHEESWADFKASEDLASGFSMDTMARSLNRDEFESKTLWLLRLARAGLIYTSLALHVEEQRRSEERDPNEILGPMISDRWDDDWKT